MRFVYLAMIVVGVIGRVRGMQAGDVGLRPEWGSGGRSAEWCGWPRVSRGETRSGRRQALLNYLLAC